MRRHLSRVLALLVFCTAHGVWASHPMEPVQLAQELGGAALPVGMDVDHGVPVDIVAWSNKDTYGSGYTYFLELEIQKVSQAFTDTPTHLSGSLLKPSNINVHQVYPKISVTLAPGEYKWQVREKVVSSTGSVSLSDWVEFNGGQLAFSVIPQEPDLVVDAVVLTQSVSDQTNKTLELTWSTQLRNRGNSATNAGGGTFVWRAWLSTDQALQHATDTLIYTSPTSLTIGAKSTLTQTATALVDPAPATGTYYILVEADPASVPTCTSACGEITEYDELNNVGATANPFIQGVDLVAESISGQPAVARPGDVVTFQVKFRNQGVDTPPASQNPAMIRIWASRDPVRDAKDSKVYEHSLTVTGGMTFDEPLTLTLPSNVAGGKIWWLLEVDSLNTIVEAKEDNNVVASIGQTHVHQADLRTNTADLVHVLTGVSTRVVDMGEPARFDVEIENLGDFGAGPHEIGVVISRDTKLVLLPGSDEIFADVPVAGLAQPSGSTKSVRREQLVVTLPTMLNGKPLETGTYYFFILADSRHDFNEVDEDNNAWMVAGPVRVRRPGTDYAVTQVTAPAEASAGESMQITRTLANVGTDDGAAVEYRCFASANTIITDGDFPLSFVEPDGTTVLQRTVQLDRGEVDVRTETLRLPGSMPAGEYAVGCLIDSGQIAVELDETNNAAVNRDPTAIAAQSFRIVTQQLPDASLGSPYAVQLASAGAKGAVTWSLANGAQQLPEGLALGSDGTLTGTPTAIGLRTVRVAAESGGARFESVLFVRVLPPTVQLTLTTDALPPIVNDPELPYQAILSALGGKAPYRWSIVSGVLPPGLQLTPAGVLSGTPRDGLANSETRVTFRVQDDLGSAVARELRVKLLPRGALVISTHVLPDQMVGQSYLTELAAEAAGGGTLSKPLSWEIVGGRLPVGISMTMHGDQVRALLEGTPVEAGLFPLTVQVTDANGRFDTTDLVLSIHASQLRISSEGLPATRLPGEAVDVTVISDSSTTATFRLFSGTLPKGVALADNGRISGTIDAAAASVGRYDFVIEAVDARGAKGLAAFTVDVESPPVVQGCSSTGTGSAAFGILALLGLALRVRRTHRYAAVHGA